ncbi:RNA repair transcriptional activator RtcR [Taklimakanibacter lacteus]|uniref:RNA repair transcriptional activator RtcR n=1 Tax=Taklimakanibacter lacteus TaxID=2268456 RepID=UPI000E664A83
MTKANVVIGFLGTTLDVGKWDTRWERWRPTIAVCQQDDFIVDRLELIHDDRSASLARRLIQDINQVSPETKVASVIINLKDPWDFEEVYGALHDFARGRSFDTESENYFVNITTGTHVAQICWFLLAETRHVPAKLLQLSPPKKARGDLTSPMRIIDLDLSRYDRIATRFRAEQRDAASFLKSGIATRNPAFNRMIDRIEQVAINSKAPFLLMGPTGAGKSQLARRIYELKKTRHQIEGPFVDVNCATLRGDTAMSSLFGHVKGAFTGAQAARSGLLKSADGGLLFLDEIGELGPDEQAMILRAIEEKRFLAVGADKETASDFQLVAGTNRDLNEAVRSGHFREDLLARLNLWTFALPALRDRPEDIEPNIDFELDRQARDDGAKITFNKEARLRFTHFATSPDAKWSANFRDLSASITRMATLAPKGRIDEATVGEEIERLKALWSGGRRDAATDILNGVFSDERLARIDLFDQSQLATVIAICRDSASLSAAGRRLFAASRREKTSGNDADRLRKYLARFDLDWATVMAR